MITRITTTLPPVIRLAIINETTVLTDAQVQAAALAIQVQVTRDFYPAWAINAEVFFFTAKSVVPADYWQVALLDDSDQAGALGYHDVTATGQPLAKVFAKSAMANGYSWTVTLSHEVCEMLADPYASLTVFAQTSNTAGSLFAFETADPVEADSLGYMINGIMMSDFVYPSWFDTFRPANSTRFSQMHSVTAPFQLAKGGYASSFDVTAGGGWKQTFARTEDIRVLSPEYAPRIILRSLAVKKFSVR